MSKARVDWISGERPVGSAKLDEVATDYITPGVPIWSFCIRDFAATEVSSIILGFYPYHPSRSVYDRLRVLGSLALDGADNTTNFQLSFNSGSSWTGAFPSAIAAPVDFATPGADRMEDWNLDAQVAGFQWLGVRANVAPVAQNLRLALFGFLFRSTDPPF